MEALVVFCFCCKDVHSLPTLPPCDRNNNVLSCYQQQQVQTLAAVKVALCCLHTTKIHRPDREKKKMVAELHELLKLEYFFVHSSRELLQMWNQRNHSLMPTSCATTDTHCRHTYSLYTSYISLSRTGCLPRGDGSGFIPSRQDREGVAREKVRRVAASALHVVFRPVITPQQSAGRSGFLYGTLIAICG